MIPRAYVQVRYPWSASFERGRRAPAAYLSSLIRQTLRYGMPARRYGPVGAWAVGHALPPAFVRAGLLAHRTRTRPDLDRLVADVEDAWAALAARSARLSPEPPPRISILSLRRRSAETVFVFGDEPRPLIVCKVPLDDASTLELETTALAAAAPLEIAPRPLGRLGDAFVQEGLPGSAMEVAKVTPANAAALEWRSDHRLLGEGLTRLAAATARAGRPQELRNGVKAALERAELPRRVRDLARAALEDLEDSSLVVLRHGDTSPQNCLFDRGDLSGLVDWEIARPEGAPGFDIMNAAVASLDQGVGLVRWSEERALQCFRAAWRDSPLFAGARRSARAATTAAGASDAEAERLEIAFFARRLASRAAAPSSYATGPRTAASMLETVCER